ncbi:MAG: 6-phosphogluconolactonase [Actinomycetota bacterium]
MDIRVFDSADDLAAGAAGLLAELLRETPTGFGLAGGSTPRATYRQLIEHDVPWSDVTCWLPDERWVPPEDPDANALMARHELIHRVPVRFLAPDTTLDNPRIAASAYEADLADEFGDDPGIVLLGIGSDGHTASLFPGTDALDNDHVGYVANWVPQLGVSRLTATIPLLHRASHIVFLVSGETKARVLRRILADEEPFPARKVADGADAVTWLVDRDAASELEPRSS